MLTAAGKMSAAVRSIRAVSKPSVRADAPARAEIDACPGALRLHAAADGPLARVRVPGGRLTGAQLAQVRALAERWGDGHVELTSRANLQLRALTSAPVVQLAARLGAAGLLPSPTHELVRNIAASPLPEGPIDLPAAVKALDQALCAEARLAGLPGRFLFALDNGDGDVAFSADVAALPRDSSVAILFAGVDVGLRVEARAVVPALLAGAHAFLDERADQQGSPPPTAADTPHLAPPGDGYLPPSGGPSSSQPDISVIREPAEPSGGPARPRVAWRVRELTDGPTRVGARTATALGLRLDEPAGPHRPPVREPVGVIAQADGRVAVGALVPLGRLSPIQVKVLESAVDLVFTPWRGVVVPDLEPADAGVWVGRLAGAGLEVAAGSRWAGVTACAGRPGCAKALADVRGDASAATTAGDGLPVHWVGCARGCGSPAGPHVRVEATGAGYEVRSPHAHGFAPAGSDQVSSLVGAAREG